MKADTESKKAILFLKEEISFKNKVIKKLIKYYETSQEAIAMEKKGHTLGWDKVQELADDIEDNFDLAVLVKDL